MGYYFGVYIPKDGQIKDANNAILREQIKSKLKEISEFKNCEVVLYTVKEVV
jgi:hypothetical protein